MGLTNFLLLLQAVLVLPFFQADGGLECYVGFSADHVGYLRQCSAYVPCVITFNPQGFFSRGCGKISPGETYRDLITSGCFYNMTRTNGKFICACNKDRCNDWVQVPP